MAAAALGVRWTRWWRAAGPCDCGTCRRWPSSGGEEHHCDVPVTDDECDRPDQQLPHPGNHRRARDHTSPATAKPSALPAPTHNQRGGGNQRGAGQRRGLWDRGMRASDRSTNGEIETRTRNTEAVRSQTRDHRVAVVQRIFSGIEFSACRTCTASSLAALSPSLE